MWCRLCCTFSLFFHCSTLTYVKTSSMEILLTKDNDVIPVWKPKWNRSLRRQGLLPFWVRGGTHYGTSSFSDPRSFQVHSRDRASFFSATRVLKRGCKSFFWVNVCRSWKKKFGDKTGEQWKFSEDPSTKVLKSHAS